MKFQAAKIKNKVCTKMPKKAPKFSLFGKEKKIKKK